MKAHLMFRDRDFDIDRRLPAGSDELTQDLELDVLFDAMAGGDAFLRDVARKAVLLTLTDPATISYRQEILTDCLRNPDEVRGLYRLVVESIEGEKQARWWGYGRSPSTILSAAIRLMRYYVDVLRNLKESAERLRGVFGSEGLTTLCETVTRELGNDYISSVERRIAELEFRHGVLISAELGDGNKGKTYVLRMPTVDRRPWIERLFTKKAEAYTYTVPDRDEAGARALSELTDRGINSVADALAQSVDHVRSFYAMLKAELAFYVGCLNLSARLQEIGEPICLPELSVLSEEAGRRHSFCELYDACLALTVNRSAVGNDVSADDRRLVIITGANHGGKSTFLRSVGLSQLMMQCGMFVPARSYVGVVCDRIFTHFKRREDAGMESGKLDEELKRMSRIVDELSPNSLVLFNESFAATNEREGSEIARQIVRALVENGVTAFFVTHLYDFARSFYDDPPVNTLFLRAERLPDGRRSFKLTEAQPLETSYGRDLYAEVFGDEIPAGDSARMK